MKKALIFLLSAILIAGTAVSIINSRKAQDETAAPTDSYVSTNPDQSAVEPDESIIETTSSRSEPELKPEPDPEIVSSVYNTGYDQNMSALEGNWQAPNGNIVSVNRYGTCWIYRANGSVTTGSLSRIDLYAANDEYVRTEYELSSFVHIVGSWSVPETLDMIRLDNSGNLILESDASTSYVRTGAFEYISQESSPVPVLKGARSESLEVISADANWNGGYHYHRCSKDGNLFVNSIAFSKASLQMDYERYSDPYEVVFRYCAGRLSHWEIQGDPLKYNEACSQRIGRPVYTYEFTSLENESTRQWFMLGFDTEDTFYIYTYDFPIAMTGEMSSIWAEDITGLYLG